MKKRLQIEAHELEGVQPADTLALQVGSQWTINKSDYLVTLVRKLANGGLDIHFESMTGYSGVVINSSGKHGDEYEMDGQAHTQDGHENVVSNEDGGGLLD